MNASVHRNTMMNNNVNMANNNNNNNNNNVNMSQYDACTNVFKY